MTIPGGFVLVSGGSRGLGFELVSSCLRRGAKVAAFARSSTPAIETLCRDHQASMMFEPADIEDDRQVEGVLRRACDRFGPVWALVNNAAIGQDHLLAHTPVGVIRKIISVNLLGTICLTRLVVKRMLTQGTGGRIINISSICGSKGYPALSVYSATKGALDAFSRSLAHELGERNIVVNSIAPGFFSSDMSSVLSTEQMETIRRRTPTGTLATVEQVVSLFDYLLFESTNLSGQTFFVDGGISS